MKKTILFLAALGVVAPQTSHADRFEIGANVGFQVMNSLSQKSKNPNQFKSSTMQLVAVEGTNDGTFLVGFPDSVAQITDPALPMTNAAGEEISQLQIAQVSLDYTGANFLGKSIPGVVAGGSLSYIMDIPCSPMFVDFRLGLSYYGSKTAITPNASETSMIVYTQLSGEEPDFTYGLVNADVVSGKNQVFDVQGKLRNKLALNFEVALGAAVTKNVEVALGVGYSGVQSNLSYVSAMFKEYPAANNLTLNYGFVAAGSVADGGDILSTQKMTSKNVWQSGVSLSAAVTYKVSDSFGVRLRSEATFFGAKEHAISYNPSSWASTQEAFAAETQTGSLRIQNTIMQTSVEFVYMMGVGSQPSAA
jgi:hypothetical protein